MGLADIHDSVAFRTIVVSTAIIQFGAALVKSRMREGPLQPSPSSGVLSPVLPLVDIETGIYVVHNRLSINFTICTRILALQNTLQICICGHCRTNPAFRTFLPYRASGGTH